MKPYSVIVFAGAGRHVGVMVDKIEDIVNEEIAVRHTSTVRGLLGSAVLGGRITDMLDLDAVAAAAGETSFQADSNSHGLPDPAVIRAIYGDFHAEAVQ